MWKRAWVASCYLQGRGFSQYLHHSLGQQPNSFRSLAGAGTKSMSPAKQSHSYPAMGNFSLGPVTTRNEFGSFKGLCDKIHPLSGSCESFWAGAEQVLHDGDAEQEGQQPWGLLWKLQPLLVQLSLQCFTAQNMQTMVFQDFQGCGLCRPSLSQDCNRTWLVLQSWR